MLYYLNMILYFVIALGILILIHEFGHFIAARMCKMRVDIFSFGMGYRLFGYNQKTGFTFGKLPDNWESDGFTDYRLSLFPIGGYVKIVGMIDESFDTDFIKSEPKPWEFRSKNAFQKAFAISAGVIMNYLLAAIIFSGMIYFNGSFNILTTEVGYVVPEKLGDKIGFKTDDKILSINGKEIQSWNEVFHEIQSNNLGDDKHIKVLRNGHEEEIFLSSDSLLKALENKQFLGIEYGEQQVVVETVQDKSPADSIGIENGDIIVAINGEEINHNNEVVALISSSVNKNIFIMWNHEGQIKSDSAFIGEDGVIGIHMSGDIEKVYTGKKEHIEYGLFASAIEGINTANDNIALFIDSFVQMFRKKLEFEKSVGGPIAIAKMSAEQAERGMDSFLKFVALLSIMLAIINILPFPALDGGHLLFIIIEAIIRRELPIKFKMAVQQIGFFILMGFMVYVLYIDLARVW